MNHGSLYSGIGMWLLAAWKAGYENVFTCENDNFCNQILDKRFPNTDRLHDIKETDFSRYKGQIDVLTSSDPCQPFSYNGARRGTNDNRFLWPETVRSIYEIRPSVIVFENVYGFINLAFDRVALDLEGQGYEVEAFVIPACAIGAPHRRERVWILAYTNSTGADKGFESIPEAYGEIRQPNQDSESGNTDQHVPNTIGTGLEGSGSQGRQQTPQPQNGTKLARTKFPRGEWDKWWAAESGLGGMADGYANWLDEPVPRLTTVKTDRTKRVKAIGNAIVPQLGYLILETVKSVYFTE